MVDQLFLKGESKLNLVIYKYCREIAFIILVVAIVCISNCFCQAEEIDFQKIDSNKVPAELMSLSSATHANYEKIRTWQGEMTMDGTLIYRGNAAEEELKNYAGVDLVNDINELRRVSGGTIDFKIDVENDLYFKHVVFQTAVYEDMDKHRTYNSLSGPMERTKIITPEYQIRIYPVRRTKDFVALERTARKQLPNPISETSDPRKFFNAGSPIWVLLSQLSQTLENPTTDIGVFGVSLEKAETEEDNISYRVKISNPGKKQEFLTVVLKSEVGFNPTYIEYRSDEGVILTKASIDFIKIQGIFLPNKMALSQFDSNDGGLRRKMTYTITDMQINQPIPDNTFSVNNYLVDGDSFIDEINSKKYVYQSGEFVQSDN